MFGRLHVAPIVLDSSRAIRAYRRAACCSTAWSTCRRKASTSPCASRNCRIPASPRSASARSGAWSALRRPTRRRGTPRTPADLDGTRPDRLLRRRVAEAVELRRRARHPVGAAHRQQRRGGGRRRGRRPRPDPRAVLPDCAGAPRGQLRIVLAEFEQPPCRSTWCIAKAERQRAGARLRRFRRPAPAADKTLNAPPALGLKSN